MKKFKITDKEAVQHGADYTFVCGKIPFAITCSKILPHGENNLIDLDLVNKMKIPLLNIRVRRIQILGQECQSVGTVDQTIQCVADGKLQGTIHLSATVIRNLYDNFNVDCLASAKTFTKLVGNAPPKSCHDADALEEDENDEEVPNLDSGVDEMMIKGGQHDEDLYKLQKQIDREKPPDDPQQQLGVPPGEDLNKIIERDLARLNHIKGEIPKPFDYSQDDDLLDEDMCDLCFFDGKPINATRSHTTNCPTCPSMTNKAKLNLFGPNWRRAAKEIFQERHRRKKEELRRHT